MTVAMYYRELPEVLISRRPGRGSSPGRGLLMNSAMMPTAGLVYWPVSTTPDVFAETCRGFHWDGLLVSFIGYQQTADFLSHLCGIPVAVSRDPAIARSGDTLLICKLVYRVADPATKGKPVSVADFEFLTCTVSDW